MKKLVLVLVAVFALSAVAFAEEHDATTEAAPAPEHKAETHKAAKKMKKKMKKHAEKHEAGSEEAAH